MMASALELELLAPSRRRAWLGYALLAGSLALAAALLSHYRDLQRELARLEAATALLAGDRREASPRSPAQAAEEIKSAEAVLRQLALPWVPLVEAVEQASTAEVAVLQLQPDAQQHSLRVAAEARDQKAMLAYLRRLAAAEVLSEAHIVSHQVQAKDPQRPIQFAVQASFRSGR